MHYLMHVTDVDQQGCAEIASGQAWNQKKVHEYPPLHLLYRHNNSTEQMRTMSDKDIKQPNDYHVTSHRSQIYV